MDIGAYIERTNAASTKEEVFRLFLAQVGEIGLGRCVFAGGSNDETFRKRYGISDSAPIISNSYPEDWTKHYLERGYIQHDPVYAKVARQWEPLIWDGLRSAKLSARQRRIMDEAVDSGLRNGISLPLHGPGGDLFVISLASEYGGDLGLTALIPMIRLVATQFFFTFVDRWTATGLLQRAPELTARERECLQWCAHGKSAWEIGAILHISEPTVRFHLSNAFRKLGAQNRISATVRAVRWGLISL